MLTNREAEEGKFCTNQKHLIYILSCRKEKEEDERMRMKMMIEIRVKKVKMIKSKV